MFNQIPNNYMIPAMNQTHDFHQQQLANLEQRVNKLERDIKRLESKVNYLEQGKSVIPNNNYQPNSYNMF